MGEFSGLESQGFGVGLEERGYGVGKLFPHFSLPPGAGSDEGCPHCSTSER